MIGVSILGATGSIGVNTLDVIAAHPSRFRVVALSAYRDVEGLAAQCRLHQPELAVMVDEQAAIELRQRLREAGVDTEVASGSDALQTAASLPGTDCVMAAIVGAAGLLPTLAAVRAGRRVLLANKEALVMAGNLLMHEVARCGAQLLPIDSEHNAILQCLPHDYAGDLDAAGVRRLILTASGGPLRTLAPEAMASVTPEQACAHPTWTMGRKISVDSATMMNKGLEVIEACCLFDAPAERVDVVVHPQSLVHSMVEYVDGSVLVHMGHPDMRTPIAHALAWPERIDFGAAVFDVTQSPPLEFEPPDPRRFPCLALAMQALSAGGGAPAVLNAANEIAVAAFLDGRLRFDAIAPLIEQTLAELPAPEVVSLEDVMALDEQARRVAGELAGRLPG